MMGMINLFHKYIKPGDMIDKQASWRCWKRNFPNFLKVCDKKGKGYLYHFFEQKNNGDKIKKNGDKIPKNHFPSFSPGWET